MSSKLFRKVYRIERDRRKKAERHKRFLFKFKDKIYKELLKAMSPDIDGLDLCIVGYGSIGFCCIPNSKIGFHKYVIEHGYFLRSFMMYDLYILLGSESSKYKLKDLWQCNQAGNNCICYLNHKDLAYYTLPIRCKSSYVTTGETTAPEYVIRKFKHRSKPSRPISRLGQINITNRTRVRGGATGIIVPRPTPVPNVQISNSVTTAEELRRLMQILPSSVPTQTINYAADFANYTLETTASPSFDPYRGATRSNTPF